MLGMPITIKRQQGKGGRKWGTTELWITLLEIIKITLYHPDSCS